MENQYNIIDSRNDEVMKIKRRSEMFWRAALVYIENLKFSQVLEPFPIKLKTLWLFQNFHLTNLHEFYYCRNCKSF